MPPRIMLATLCLNEMQWLPYLYAQHKDWPGMTAWVFVEAADVVYQQTNPDLVSPEGLSVDDTTDYLSYLAQSNSSIVHVRHGLTSHPKDPAQGKCAARDRYLELADDIKPDYLIVLDSDEFYTFDTQCVLPHWLNRHPNHTGFCFRHREVWYPPSAQRAFEKANALAIEDYSSRLWANTFSREVVGGFWSIPYCRVWRWHKGMRYVSNHNTPEVMGSPLDRMLKRYDTRDDAPQFVHLGFASRLLHRRAKNDYYRARGEGSEKDQRRGWYVESRKAWETWQEGDELPNGARVIPYNGPIPEVFKPE